MDSPITEIAARAWSRPLDVCVGENIRRDTEGTRHKHSETGHSYESQSTGLEELGLRPQALCLDAEIQEACASQDEPPHRMIRRLHIFDLPDELLIAIFKMHDWEREANKWYYSRRASATQVRLQPDWSHQTLLPK